MSNDEFAALIGVGPSMASRIRNGRRLPSTRVIQRIHSELGIPLEALMAAHEKGGDTFGQLVRERLDAVRTDRVAA